MRFVHTLSAISFAAVYAATPLVAAQASGAHAGNPAYQAAIAELRDMHTMCSSMGGTMIYDDGHLAEVNFTDDGQTDFVIVAEKAYCDGFVSMFCGSGGCSVNAFATKGSSVVPGYFSLHGPQVGANAVSYGCSNGGSGQLSFAGGDFELSGC